MFLFLILFGMFAMIFSMFGAYNLLKSSSKAKRSLLWSAVDGQVKVAEVHQESVSSRGGISLSKPSLVYWPIVFYTYSVNGVTYNGNIISVFSVSANSYEKALNRILPYKGAAWGRQLGDGPFGATPPE